jgi:hypothetical protein
MEKAELMKENILAMEKAGCLGKYISFREGWAA